ncbi:MAG TPA: hypothetical protein VJ889_01920 [Pseudomonas sp.]|nr:hypothetical protein [Pseudomonas sp.]
MDMNLQTDVIKHGATLMGDIVLTGIQAQPVEDYNFALSCSYLAKKQADSVYDSDTQPGRWIDYYADVLWSHGWNRDQPSIEYVKPQFSGSVKEAWLKLASPLLSVEHITGVEAGLAALEERADLLEKTTGISGKAFDVKIVPISYNANGDLEMVISTIRFIKSSVNTSYLFWKISQVMTQLDIRARRVVISRRVMDARRPSVEKAIKGVSFNFKDYEL